MMEEIKKRKKRQKGISRRGARGEEQNAPAASSSTLREEERSVAIYNTPGPTCGILSPLPLRRFFCMSRSFLARFFSIAWLTALSRMPTMRYAVMAREMTMMQLKAMPQPPAVW